MRYFIGILLTFIWLTPTVCAQTLDEARKLYLEGKYAAALPAFETAIKSSPKNASYNQWYGTCLLETGRLKEAFQYLEFAASKDIMESYNSLGKLHYLLYEFEESVDAYEEYEQLLIKSKKTAEADLVKPLIERSKRSARMLSRCEDIQIIDSVIIDKEAFLDAYFISKEVGYLESKDNSVLYENSLKDNRYFAKKNEFGQYRLFHEMKLQDNWYGAKELSLNTDSLENNNYPFVLSDGVTIYYASTGNGSIGGYDLFVTRYNSNNDTYLAPSQMGMPFNSIANDYMMVIDENNMIGYFTTDRFQPDDKVIVYTFIFNEEVNPINTEEEAQLIDRAQITSIRDTWKDGVDYVSILSEVRKSIFEEQNKKQKDFFFVINDNIVYYTLADFENEVAKQTFLKSKQIENEISELEKDLDTLRQNYSNGSVSLKQSLKETILSKENRFFSLLEQNKRLAVDARNLEIKHLRSN